ncbi:hypothetical protein D3C87_124900 [compost metagenome]
MATSPWDFLSPQLVPNPTAPAGDVPIVTKLKNQKAIGHAADVMIDDTGDFDLSMKPAPQSSQQQLEQAYQQMIQQRTAQTDTQRQQLAQLEDEKPTGLQAVNFKPLLAFADTMAGTNTSGAYQAPTAVKDWEAKKQRLQDSITKETGALTDDQLGYLKTKVSEESMDKRMKMQMDAQDRKDDKHLKSAASGLRNEWLKNPMTKATQDVAVSYEKVESAAANPSAAGDLSLIFGYMKMLDPGSTVREGEFANAQNAAGIPDQVKNMYNRAKSGQRLNENQRRDFINQAKNVYEGQLAQQERFNQSFYDLAQRSGVSPQDVVLQDLFIRKKQQNPKPTSASASAAPDFDNMSNEDLLKYTGN